LEPFFEIEILQARSKLQQEEGRKKATNVKKTHSCKDDSENDSEDDHDSEDEEAILNVSEKSLKVGYFVATPMGRRNNAATGSKDKMDGVNRLYFDSGSPIYSFKVWAASQEHIVGRAKV